MPSPGLKVLPPPPPHDGGQWCLSDGGHISGWGTEGLGELRSAERLLSTAAEEGKVVSKFKG